MLFFKFLDRVIRTGDLTVIDAAGRAHRFGDRCAPHATVRLHDRWLPWTLALRPQLRVGEAYMDGRLTIEDGTLRDFIDIAVHNIANVEPPHGSWRHRLQLLARGLMQHNPIGRARRNVAHHYDLSGELYKLFLDADRQYSCAYFPTPEHDLDAAQAAKKQFIAAKLLLDRPGLKVLDIGSGWGGMALTLAQAADCDVTGVTLSVEQHAESEARARDAGLDDRVRFHLRDYRQQHGTFDRIVSVGMFEHVGARHYDEFFAHVASVLDDDGVGLLHTIGRMEPPGSTNAWLRKYIFPGGYSPALSEVLAAMERQGLWLTDVEVLRGHYAETLREWHRRFMANRERVLELYDERFCRMWEFYLVGCEVAFRHLNQCVFQIQFARRQDAVPPTRDYIAEWQHRGEALAGRSEAAE